MAAADDGQVAPPPAPAAAAAPQSGATASHGRPELRKTLGTWDLTAVGVGGIIGAGIYVLTGQAAASYAGPAVVLSFALASVACTFSALCYSELAAMIPVAGSAYSFASATLGQFLGFWIGWDLMLEYLFGASTVAVGWSGYVCSLLKDVGITLPPSLTSAPIKFNPHTDEWESTGGLVNVPAIFVVIAMTAINVVGIQESTLFNRVVVVVKTVVLILFVFACAAFIKPANWSPFIPPAGESFGEFGVTGVFRGASVLFFAFVGFDGISTLSAEAKNPQRSIPIATISSLLVCSALYVVVGLVLTGVVSYTELGVPDPIAVAVDATGDSLLWLRPIVKVGAIFGLTSVIMVTILSQSRIFFAMAADGLLPPAFARVHPRYKTPVLATVVTGVVAAIISGFLPIDILGEMVSIGTLFAFALVCAGVVALRRSQPGLKRPFKTPWVPYVPIAGTLTALMQMLFLPLGTWLRLFIWMAVGAAIYFGYGRKHARPYALRRAQLLGLVPDAEQQAGSSEGAGAAAAPSEGDLSGTDASASASSEWDKAGLVASVAGEGADVSPLAVSGPYKGAFRPTTARVAGLAAAGSSGFAAQLGGADTSGITSGGGQGAIIARLSSIRRVDSGSHLFSDAGGVTPLDASATPSAPPLPARRPGAAPVTI